MLFSSLTRLKTNTFSNTTACLIAATGAVSLAADQASAVDVSVRFENLSADGGVFLTPLWVGFHNGSFDLFDSGALASTALERIAEDGDASGLAADLVAAQADAIGGVITSPGGFPGAPLVDPGESTSMTFTLDPTKHRYLSFASMVIPSNDAFIGSADAIELFDASGNFVGGAALTLLGSDIYDAGTEANNEMDAAFLNQTAGNTGVTTADVIAQHAGFIGSIGNPAAGETPLILGQLAGGGFTTIDTTLGDFTRNGGQDPVASLSVSVVPEPASVALIGASALGLLGRRRRA